MSQVSPPFPLSESVDFPVQGLRGSCTEALLVAVVVVFVVVAAAVLVH